MGKIYSIVLCAAIIMLGIIPVRAENCNKVGIYADAATFVHSLSPDKTGEQIDKTTLIAGRGRETFLQFDISEIEKDRLQSASLYLTTEHGGNNTVVISYLPNNSWNKEITYKTKPDTTRDIEITSLKTGTANRKNGTYSRSETDVTSYVKNGDNKISFHITGGDSAAEFASNVSDYSDRPPMLLISYGEAGDTENMAAIAQAKQYLADGITIIGALSDYKASNGITVSIKWDKVYDTTIDDEKSAYLNDTYLKPDGRLTRPKWFEGVKKLRGTAVLTAGNITETVENVSIAVDPPAKPSFDISKISDHIDIGNAQSEENVFESVRDNGIETNIVDGTVHTYRTLNKNGAMALTMKCDPEKVNYLTVKLWGNDTGDTMLWLCDPETGNMNISNTRQPSRNNGVVDRRDWVELNCLNASPQYNGGFIYTTYMIPTVYTKGKEYVSLRLYSTGGNADYSSVTIKEQTSPSRGIYAAYITQSPSFEPSAFETVDGALKKTAESDAAAYDEQKKLALTYAKSAVETFKSWQIYGQSNYPSYMEGMVTRGTDWESKAFSDSDWKDRYYQSTSGMMKQNMTPLNMYEIFALAYKNASELAYSAAERAELLDRIVKGVDFLVRAQGSDGGFYGSGWIGGPDRVISSEQHLTGFGLRSAAYAITDVYDDINKNGYMEQSIDADADGENDTVRKTAWETMIASTRDYLVSPEGAGHAPNQDMADIIAALRFEKALQTMNSGLSWKAQNKEEEIEKQLDMALGFRPNLACSSYWVSPKGLILENFGSIQGGYSGDYGTEALEEISQLVEFAEEYYGASSDKAKKYTDLIERAYECVDKFMFTANAADGAAPTLYAEGIISNRNVHYPGTERYVLDCYTALSRKNKTALKTFDYFFKHNKLKNDAGEYFPGNAHFEDNALSVLRLYLNFDSIVKTVREEKIDEYTYLMENDTVNEYAWADEMARAVVIKNGEDKIYIALNWRNPIHSTTFYNKAGVQDQQKGLMNDLARVHHKTNVYDKYGYAEIMTEGWNVKTASSENYQLFANHYAEAFMFMNYGDYTILMNSNNLMGNEANISYPVPWKELELDGLYKDLISGNYYYFGSKTDGARDGKELRVPAAETVILYKKDSVEKPTPKPTEIPEPTGIPEVTAEPTVQPTTAPTTVPTAMPVPTAAPTSVPTAAATAAPTETPTPTITAEPETVAVNYDDETVTAEFRDKTMDAEIFIYAAEYSGDGTLINVKMASKTITGSDRIEFEYKRAMPDSKIRIFVWNDQQRPLCETGEFQ